MDLEEQNNQLSYPFASLYSLSHRSNYVTLPTPHSPPKGHIIRAANVLC